MRSSGIAWGVALALPLWMGGCREGGGASTDAAADVAAPDAAAPDAAAPDAAADAPAEDAAPIEYPMPAAANAVARTDPRWNGQHAFLYDAFGTEVLDEWPPADFMVRLQRDEPAVFGDQFARFGFVPDPSDDLPLGFKRGLADRTRVHPTCALCHVARLPDGRVWLGAPNTALDVGRFHAEVSRRWVAAGGRPLLTALEEAKARRLGPGRFNAETSAYPQVVPADFPPYFDLGERTALNYMGTGRNLRTEVYLAIFTTGAGAPNDRAARVPFPSEARLGPFLAFLGTLRPPPPPPPGDAALVARGRAVFESARCGSCHHVGALAMDGVVALDRAPDGRERLPGDDPAFPRGAVRTSALHRVLQDGDGSDAGVDPGYVDLIRFIVARRLSVGMTDGYRVGDLRGLAYTAPYLHNGSVPTLEDLLRRRADRPRTFLRGDFVVDTSLPGNGNEGHEFGADLPDADRAALVAYLRSL